jgi:hypothetical protein
MLLSSSALKILQTLFPQKNLVYLEKIHGKQLQF